MKNRHVNPRLMAAGFVLLSAALSASRGLAQSAFQDNFNRANSTTLGNNWNAVTVYGINGSGAGLASISNNELLITNNSIASTTTTGLFRGRTYVYQDSANFTGPYSDTLDLNTGVVSWTFNIEQTDSATPAGLNYSSSGNYGAAVVLAADTTNFADNNTTNGTNPTAPNSNYGYALVWGNGSSYGGTYPLRLVRFSNGIYGVSSTGAPFTDIAYGGNFASGSYLSVKVTYDPSDNDWGLYAVQDTGFDDPTMVTNLLASGTDSTYTSMPLEYFGALFNYANGPNAGTGYSALFDNFGVDVALPEPTVVTGLWAVASMMMLRRSRRGKVG